MAETTGINWCDSTFNPWIGCQAISPACTNCYAADWAKRYGRDFASRTRTTPANWKQPLKWNKDADFVQCPECGWRGEWSEADDRMGCCPQCDHLPQQFIPARRRVFCASLADVFDNEVPDGWRMDLFKLIADTPNLDWLLLTKRIGNVRRYTQHDGLAFDLIGDGRVWIGATICNQEEADRDIPKLLSVPAAVRFLSIEPMLGPVDVFSDMTGELLHTSGDDFNPGCIDWIICGGESGQNARPMHPDWVRNLRDQCEAAGVPFHFKQWGEHDLSYDRDRDDPDFRSCAEMDRKPGRWINLAGGHGFNGKRVHFAHKVGKKSAGRMLDGVEHNGFPA